MGSGNGGNGGNGKACATTLNEGSYETPHLIVPVNKDSPDESYGTSYFGQVNSTTSSIFNFDIPSSYEGKTCSVVFLFPKKEDLETANYDYSGSGSMSCDKLESAATEQTTYNNVPKVSSHLNDLELESGNSYVVSTGSCEAGQKVSYQLSSEGGMALKLRGLEPQPIGSLHDRLLEYSLRALASADEPGHEMRTCIIRPPKISSVINISVTSEKQL